MISTDAAIGRFTSHRSTIHPPASRGGRSLRAAFVFVLLTTTVFVRLGVTVGSFSVGIAYLGMYVFLTVAAASGALRLSATRLAVVVVCMVLALLSTMLNFNRSSILSLLMLGSIYLPYSFLLTTNNGLNEDPAWVVRTFLNVALFCAIVGVLQFAAQFVIHADWLFDYFVKVPTVLQGPLGANTVIPIGGRFKSNGFFFGEPSAFSFMMGFAITVEATSYRRWSRFVCFGFGLLLSYSGTGLLALAIGMLFPIGRKTVVRAVVVGGAGAVAVLLLGDALNLSYTLARFGEFGSSQSSGYKRYVAPFRLVGDTIDTEAWTPWFGHGPGSISHEVLNYEFHDPTWAKLIFEYGIPGLIAFGALVALTLRRRDVSSSVRATLFFSWLVMGGHLLSPEENFFLLAMVGAVPGGLTRTRPIWTRPGPSRASEWPAYRGSSQGPSR